MLINHQSEFQSAMQDLEYLGYDLDTVAPNSRYTLKDIILNLVTEYQTVAYEEGMADGHAAGYDLGEEEGVTYGRDVGYEEGYDAGKEDGDAAGYERGHDTGYDEGNEYGYTVGWDAGFEGGDAEGSRASSYESGYAAGQNDLREELEFIGNTDEEEGVRYL